MYILYVKYIYNDIQIYYMLNIHNNIKIYKIPKSLFNFWVKFDY